MKRAVLLQVIEGEFFIDVDVPSGMNIELPKCFMKVALRVGDAGVIDAGDNWKDGLMDF